MCWKCSAAPSQTAIHATASTGSLTGSRKSSRKHANSPPLENGQRLFECIGGEVLPMVEQKCLLRPAVVGWLRKPGQEDHMNTIDYIGFDIHKKTISFCA